ncbi:MAG TPA: ATPase, T2SS/T4P/T4SS family, partial [Lachnospiraceae bacterium]|nr:ATPase, T2SS/T4P/T4SS family [Lachnospiraceae bacterium]
MDHRFDQGRRKLRLGDILVKQNVINEDQLQKALELQRGSGRKLGETMVDEGITTEEAIAHALSDQLNMEYVNLNGVQIPDEVIELVSSSIVKKYSAIPYMYDPGNANVLKVAMSDPMDMAAIDDFTIITNMQISPVVATARQIVLCIDRYYSTADVKNAADMYAKEKELQFQADEDDVYDDDVNSSPIVQLVKTMIEQAVRQRASDIHIEPMENQVRIRYRIDGALYEKMTYSPRLLAAITARIKIIGGMDISEKRKPQDGRITQVVDRQEFDI